MELKKYINISKLGDVFEWHQSQTLRCPVCWTLVESNDIMEYAVT